MTTETPKAPLPAPKAKRSFYGNRPDLAAMAKISRFLEEFDPATAGRILDMLRMGLPNPQAEAERRYQEQIQKVEPSRFSQQAEFARLRQQQAYFPVDAD